jgi:short subunit dehydrogenase-like uncharacterized protein
VRRMIDRHHERAVAAGVKVVQVCGFEALPPDLAVLLAAETARERWGEDLSAADVDVATRQPAGRIGLADLVSGGTLQSMAEALGDERSEEVADPGALVDPARAAAVRSRSPVALAPRFNGRGEAIAPMTPIAFINPPVVHRTSALLAAESDSTLEPLRYREGIAVPGNGSATVPLRYAAAAALTGMQAGFRALTRARPSVRDRSAAAMRKLLPGSATGFGPSGEKLEEWSWHLTAEAHTTGGHFVRVDLDADGHPGYLTTAKLLGEVGLLLAEDGATPERAGCLTPATAIGTGRLDRFERAGARFSVSS